jgi:predicted dehydrogenase
MPSSANKWFRAIRSRDREGAVSYDAHEAGGQRPSGAEHRSSWSALAALALLLPLILPAQTTRLIIYDPGHFHATLLQKEMYAGIDPRVTVYAPLGPELLDYLNRISLFNLRKDNPTGWLLDVHTGGDPLRVMLRDRPGNVVVFSGRNRGKIDRIQACLKAGLNVFADKPWIIHSSEMPKLENALSLADEKGLIGYDIMTERYEVTSELQRVLVNDEAVFGRMEAGAPAAPAIQAKSIHNIMKVVAGVPLKRPAWFFDLAEYGEALADVGTHVVDLVQWTAFPDQAIDHHSQIQVLAGRHWPLTISPARFQQVTGEARRDPLEFYCNNAVEYTLRGIHVKLEILWNWEAPPGAGDVYEVVYRGSRARVELRQGAAEKHQPEVYVVSSDNAVRAALRRRVADLQSRWPGLALAETASEARLVVPEKFRVGHEAHFAQVANRLFEYIRNPKSMPAWERPNMLAKYYVSTKGVELAQRP